MRTHTAHIRIFLLRLLIPAVCLCLLAACENRNNPVPNYPVYLDLDIPALYPHFVPDNGFQTLVITQKRYEYELIGYAGVLVWISMDGKYCAADLCCVNCLDPKRPVLVDGIFAVCPLCGQQYDISYGLANPVNGTAKHTLRRFGTRFNGNILQIRN